MTGVKGSSFVLLGGLKLLPPTWLGLLGGQDSEE
jgi:hypothetical protein